jgi:hypothetical protein
MTSIDPVPHYSPDPNVLERKAGEYLGRRNSLAHSGRAETEYAVIGKMRRIERRAIALAAIAGAISGSMIGASEIFILQELLDGMDDSNWRSLLPYWAAFLAFAGIVSATEIALLYWIGLHTIARLTRLAGIAVGNAGYPALAARGLARAALEFPNPGVNIFGVDPYALIPRWRIAAWNLAYKMKVGVTSFLLRVFLRRVVARVAVRSLIPLLAAPLYAVWNAVIIWRILREVRIRTFGPIAVERLLQSPSSDMKEFSTAAKEAMLHGVGEMIVRGRDAHPNFVYVVARLREQLGVGSETVHDDWQSDKLRALSADERRIILSVLELTSILGSKVHRGQAKLLQDAAREAGIGFNESELSQLRKDLMNGRALRISIGMSER